MGNVLEHYGFTNVEYIWDFVEKHPYMFPYSSSAQQEFGKRHDKGKQKEGRFVPLDELCKQEPIEAIMVLQNPSNWNDAAQAICDILVSDGRVGCNKYNPRFDFYSPKRSSGESSLTNSTGNGEQLESNIATHRGSAHEHNIPLIFCNPDLTYSGEFRGPRFTQGAFKVTVQALFKELHGREITNIQQFGKPLETTFSFVKREIQKHLACETLPERVYFIGDNPRSDIHGANNAGMFSILVRTGCFQSDEDNDLEHPAQLVCDDFDSAVAFIMERELQFLHRGQ
eukprot:CAMPEP_0117434946 /NCGR_PEP_ID=MMETSP0759-20121206/219_1 /TAXON_ID=63605 /ORGANISM="Percolomonas cosmopolitus, Strain WS" /LENGTH=283 /DNA_ID=CAMNT_0005226461 /DNA_START=352 /DNA_END=1203 /DNA_ORIENTATION=+